MSSWGERVKISIFGESHGPAIGAVLEGLPAGEPIGMDAVRAQMARRAPGRDRTSTPRKEPDAPRVLSGMLAGRTTGAPLAVVIENTNTKSGDYENLAAVPRPGHADYPAWVKYRGCNDVRGGGHFSGRLTAPLVFAGAVCRQILLRRGIHIGAHACRIGEAVDSYFPTEIPDSLLDGLAGAYFPVLDAGAKKAMCAQIEQARLDLDSVGGAVECAVTGVPAGLGGEGMFGGVESLFSSILFGIPACKGVQFGAGFTASRSRGSVNNDPYYYDGDRVKTRTNHAGGVLGGITTGMPVVFAVGFKPTPSIARPQQSVDLLARADAPLTVHGRHDPCIVPRAVPVVEAAAALALMNLDGILETGADNHGTL